MLKRLCHLPAWAFHKAGRASVRFARSLGYPAVGTGATDGSIGCDVPEYLKLEENSSSPIDTDLIRRLKDCYRAKRCFIVGNGPSLNKLDLTKLMKEYSFGVNAIFLKTDEMGFAPTYYLVEDSHVVDDNLARIRTYDQVERKFFPGRYRRKIGPGAKITYFRMNRGFYEKTSPNFRIPRFSTDPAERLFCGQSVTYISMQLAWHMGFAEVYLIGMDFTYTIPPSAIVNGLSITSTEDDPNHFHPDYFGKGKKWHDPQVDMVERCYRHAKTVYEWSGRKIYNATAGGRLEVFDRIDYDSLFDGPTGR